MPVLVIPGLGHDISAALFGEIADAVEVLAKQAD
jgi:hypothetical protein